MLPAEYYEATVLKERVTRPCEALHFHNSTCVDLLYPPLPAATRVTAGDGTIAEVDENGDEQPLGQVRFNFTCNKFVPFEVPVEVLPALVGTAVYIKAENRSRKVVVNLEVGDPDLFRFRIAIQVPKEDSYLLLLEYHNAEKDYVPVDVTVSQKERVLMQGKVAINHCPYA